MLRLINYFSIPQFGGSTLKEEEMTAENVKKQMTDEEWQKVYDMSRDKNLYHNLCSSLFPTIHGESTCQGPQGTKNLYHILDSITQPC